MNERENGTFVLEQKKGVFVPEELDELCECGIPASVLYKGSYYCDSCFEETYK